MTGDREDNDLDENLGAGAARPDAHQEHSEGDLAALEARAARKRRVTRWFGFGGLALVATIVVLAGIGMYNRGGAPTPVAVVGEASRVAAVPGSPDASPLQIKQASEFDNQERRTAEQNGDRAFLQSSIVRREASSETPPPPPPPAPVTTAKRVSADSVYHDDGTPKSDLMRKAVLDLIVADQTPTALISSTPDDGTTSRGLVRVAGSAEPRRLDDGRGSDAIPVSADRAADRGPARGKGELIAAPHRAYAATRVAATSDVPDEVDLEVLDGPLVTGHVYGKAEYRNKKMGIHLSRLNWNGADYTIDAMVVTEDRHSPDLDADVEEHYFDRLFLPAVAGALGKVGTVGSQPTTSVNTTTAVGTVTQTSPLSATQLGLAAAGGAGTAAATVLTAEAAATQPTVSLDANKPQVVVFLRGVYTGDRQ